MAKAKFEYSAEDVRRKLDECSASDLGDIVQRIFSTSPLKGHRRGKRFSRKPNATGARHPGPIGRNWGITADASKARPEP